MKFVKKFLIISICSFISAIAQINYGICSDNMPVVPQPAQNIQQAPDATVPEQPSTQAIPSQIEQPPQLPPSLPTGAATSANQGFFQVFINMLKALASVIIVIIAMTGVIILYKRMKSKTPTTAKPKQTGENNEPSTVSEAVSSFVRHKIKRTS